MGRLLSILLILALCTGVSAMAQKRVKHQSAQQSRARTERIDKRKVVKISKTDKSAELPRTDGPATGMEPVVIDQGSSEPMQQVYGEHVTDVPQPRIDGEVIYTEPDEMPQFPGGLNGLMEFLSSNIVYPPVAAENNVQGKVLVQFVVEKDGSVGEVKILRSVEVNLDYEAIRLCKLLPKFKPGLVDGKPVRVWYTLPINFLLD